MLKLDLLSTNERTIIDFGRWNINDAVVLGHYKYNRVYPGLPLHKHNDMIEICYYVKGEQTYEVQSSQYQINGGDIFITFPDEWHGTAGFPEDKGELYWLIVDVVKARRNKSFLNFSDNESVAFCDSLLNLPKRHFKGTGGMKKQLDSLLQFYPQKHLTIMDALRIKHLITGFLLEVISSSKSHKESENDKSLIKVTSFIKENIDANFSIEQLADLIHLSESRFKSWFRQQKGIPPLEYVLRKKVQYAKTLLCNKNYSVMDVAYKSGFSSPQYFSKVFKKFTGLIPTDFRKQSV